MLARHRPTNASLPNGPRRPWWVDLLPGRAMRRRHGPKPRPWTALSVLGCLLLAAGPSAVGQEIGTLERVADQVEAAANELIAPGGSGSGSGGGGEGAGGGSHGSPAPSATSTTRSAGTAKGIRHVAGAPSITRIPATPSGPATIEPAATRTTGRPRCSMHVDREPSVAFPEVLSAGFARKFGDTVSLGHLRASVGAAHRGQPLISIANTNDADGDGCFSQHESISRPGERVEFRIDIRNTGRVPVRIQEIRHSFGMLTLGVCYGLIGSSLEGGDSATCSYTRETLALRVFGRIVNLAEVIASPIAEQRDARTARATSTVVIPLPGSLDRVPGGEMPGPPGAMTLGNP